MLDIHRLWSDQTSMATAIPDRTCLPSRRVPNRSASNGLMVSDKYSIERPMQGASGSGGPPARTCEIDGSGRPGESGLV